MTGLVFVQFSEWQQNHFVFFQQCEVDWCSVFTDVYNHYTTQYAFARLSIFVVLYVRWYRDHCHAAAPKCTVCILRRSCIRKRTALLKINEIQRSLTSGAQRHIKGRNATRVSFNPLTATSKPHSNGPSYGNTAIDTQTVDGWAVTVELIQGWGDWAGRSTPGPSSLYQM